MSSRISWDCYEVALLLSSYERVAGGSDINTEAAKLSATLRNLAIYRGILIDETYRNVNGTKMQFANVQYLFTDGKKGLSGASVMIRQMYELYTTNPAKYQAILEEANRMTGTPSTSVKDSFLAYAKDKIGFSPEILVAYLQKAADYCRLKQPLLGMTDPKVVYNIQRKVVEGKLLRFRFGKDAQAIRKVTQLYYAFIKSYPEPKEDAVTQPMYLVKEPIAEQDASDATKQEASESVPIISMEEINTLDETAETSENIHLQEEVTSISTGGEIPEKMQNEEWILMQLKARGLTYQDKRSWGGCLWIVGNHGLDAFVQKCRAKGYKLSYKADGCKTYPNCPVWWTKDYVEEKIDTSDFRRKLDENFKPFLLTVRKLTASTAAQYSQSIEAVERFMLERELDCTLNTVDPDEVQQIYDMLMKRKSFVDWNNQRHYQYSAALAQYVRYLRQDEVDPQNTGTLDAGTIKDVATKVLHDVDDRWLPILQDSFPDGYILNDSLGQFQAAAFWQERYGEECSIQGEAIDAAMKAIGVVRDGRVFVNNDEDNQLISVICVEINDILSHYSTVYQLCIYNRYQEQLAACSIYTEQVMTQQLLNEAKDAFYSENQIFAKRGQYASVIQDVRRALRDHGGPMPVSDVAKVLWFIPYDTIYHCLSVDEESINIGNSTWMLAEHFPLTREDAGKIGDILDEHLLTSNYVQASGLILLLKDCLPGIADDLNGMNYMAIFNIVAYYLRDRFSFTKAIISPKGSNVDFTALFKSFAAERDTFTLADLEMLASELKLPIYWECIYDGGAVRVSKTDFVNRRLMNFNVDVIDEVLQDFCPKDYLPLMAVSSAMMMHLPSCGYQWNGYLLQSYVFGFSKRFGLYYSSFGKTGYYGAMVRRSCETINNYASLIERVLTDDDTWETTSDALDVLVKHGYQALRKYKGIDTAMARAKQNKLSSEDRG